MPDATIFSSDVLVEIARIPFTFFNWPCVLYLACVLLMDYS